MSDFYADLLSRLKAAQGLEADTPSTKDNSPGLRVLTLGEALEESVPDGVRRKQIFERWLEPVITKLVRTPDIATLRMASVSDRMATRRNRQTPFLNYLESQGDPAIINDYQYQFDEWNIGTDTADLWNIEDDLPSEAKSNRPRRSNTLTCVGNTLNISLMAQEMGEQQSNVDLMAREIDMEITRIRRRMNAALLSNTEVKFEMEGSVPQLGGFVTRSTLNGVSAGGGDLTRALLQGRVDAIANNGHPEGLGYNLPLMGLTSARQLQVMRDILISEYNGIFPSDRDSWERTMQARTLAEYNVDVQQVFETLPGPYIPFILESQLPAGTTIIFDSQLPRLAKMRLMGQLGPWVLARPTVRLQALNVVFDLFTLEDPLVESRAVITNHL